MRVLLIYCHPNPDSFNASVRDVVLETLQAAGAEVRLTDLYKRDFRPALSSEELCDYLDCATNQKVVQNDVNDLYWCDTLIFVYPTWWYGLPAMLKGWLDRVLVPGVAFLMPQDSGKNIERGLTHITRLAVFTTCGASWGLTQIMGSPGKRMILRGVRSILSFRCKTQFTAHYQMDASTPASRAAHLERVRRRMTRFVGSAGSQLENVRPSA